jgi:selenide,water dikinase
VRPEGAARSLVLTLDVITPIVDDPGSFGRISAANALSDVYAMGGAPEVALSFVGVPDQVGLDVLEAILRGMTEKAHEAGCAVVGGHSIRDTEPKCGLAVVGSVEPGAAWTHRRGEAGQLLVLTKPIGTGVIAQALRKDQAEPAWLEAAIRSMETLNRAACDAGRAHGVTAATDVTGFGLLGHLSHITAASGLSATVRPDAVPQLPGAIDAARAGHIPGGSRKNLAYARPHLRGADAIEPALLTLLADAQTSGGLLLTVPAGSASALLAALQGAAVIGELVDREPGVIELG